jgi:predicted lipoprotein with Yx(FWY)xxD motif
MPKPLTLRALLASGSVLVAVVLLVPAAQATSHLQLSTVKVGTRKVAKLGTILVDSKGRTLYMFVPDKQRKVTCVATCAKIWPPLKLAAGAKATAAGAAKQSLLGSDRNPAGGRVVTYDKWPLYTYVSDTAPGQTRGQALNLNGGLWYVLSPSGKVIKTKAGGGYP